MNENFLETIAKTDVGKDLIKLLKEIETYHADIRNLNGVSAEVRIDALKILRSALLDKLLVLSGEIEPPNTDEYN
jgi:hypothetical protein